MGGRFKGSSLHHRRSTLRHLDSFAAAIFNITECHPPACRYRAEGEENNLIHFLNSRPPDEKKAARRRLFSP